MPPRVERRVFSPQAAWLTLDMLADPQARRPAFGQELPADLPYPVAVKTGTARGFADTVAVFVTRELTVAAWSGRFDGGATEGVLGMEGAAPLARAALLLASDGRELSLPPPPEGLPQVAVCTVSGEPAGPDCPHRKLERFVRGSVPEHTCAWHDRRDGEPSVRYPARARAWAQRTGHIGS